MAEATLASGTASSGAADEYGGFWIRSLAYSADMSIIILALLAAAVPFAFLGGTGMSIYGLIATLGLWAYFVWFAASEQQATYGKQLCGLKIEHAASGERISLLRSLGREAAKLVSGAVLLLGFVIVGFTPSKQGLHDFLATTVVVREGTARIPLAIIVAVAGVLIPVIVIPLMFGAMFAALMMMLMGAVMGGATMGGSEMKQIDPQPRIEQPARRMQPTAPPQSPAPKPAIAVEATTNVPVPEPKPAPVAPARPQAAAPAMRAGAAPSPCVYKPVMSDADMARCR